MSDTDNAYRSLLQCPNCGGVVLSSSAAVSIGMSYDTDRNAWVPDFGDFDAHEAAKEAYETFDDANDMVLCDSCDFEAEGMFFRSVINDEMRGYRDDKVKEFRVLADAGGDV